MSFVDVLAIWMIVLVPSILLVATIWAISKAGRRRKVSPKVQAAIDSLNSKRAVSPTFVARPKEEWVTEQDGYTDVRSFYMNLCVDDVEWEIPRQEVMMGIGIRGFDVMGEAAFTGCEGPVNRIAFWTEPEGGTPVFWMNYGTVIHLNKTDELKVATPESV